MLVQTAHGPVQGFTDSHPLQARSTAHLASQPGDRPPVHKWLGIPYAHAQRFKRPQDPKPWSDPKLCYEFGSQFPQPPSMTETMLAKMPGYWLRDHIPTSEHSHSVNVFAPGDFDPLTDDNGKLPVLVWIYGGALNNGSSDRFFYDPTEWIRDGMAMTGTADSPPQRCIIVSGNYRTNIFGFCASQDLAEEDLQGLCGNYGLYDCVKMLEWVQTNISAFGGDPSRVTVFGQSAGAFLVSHLMVSGRQLFQRAICMSGAANTMMLRPASKAYTAYSTILEALGITPTASSSSSERLSALRAAPADSLLQLHMASHSFTGLSLTLEPTSAADGIWTRDTMKRFREGERDPWIKEVVMGTTEDEGSTFAMGMGITTRAGWNAFLERFEPDLRARIEDKYLAQLAGRVGGDDNENGNENGRRELQHPEGPLPPKMAPGAKLIADMIFVNPVWDQACVLSSPSSSPSSSSSTSAASDKPTQVWLYRIRSPVRAIERASAPLDLGVFHAVDLPLVFNAKSLWAGLKEGEGENEDARSAKALGRRWMRFATEGNPDPDWKPFSRASPSWLAFAPGGETATEDLSTFEAEKLELYFAGHGPDESGEEVLGETTE